MEKAGVTTVQGVPMTQAAPVQQEIFVQVPAGVGPGQTFAFNFQNQLFNAQVPSDAEPGMQIRVMVPTAPVVVPTTPVAATQAVGVPLNPNTPIQAQIELPACRGCGRGFIREEKNRGSAKYYRCNDCIMPRFF